MSNSVRILAVEPLPLVPVTWMTGHDRSGSPSSRHKARMRSSVGAPTRVGIDGS